MLYRENLSLYMSRHSGAWYQCTTFLSYRTDQDPSQDSSSHPLSDLNDDALAENLPKVDSPLCTCLCCSFTNNLIKSTAVEMAQNAPKLVSERLKSPRYASSLIHSPKEDFIRPVAIFACVQMKKMEAKISQCCSVHS